MQEKRETWRARKSHFPDQSYFLELFWRGRCSSGEKYPSVQQPRASPRSATHDGSPEAEPCPTQTDVTVFVIIEISSPEGCGKFLLHEGNTKAKSRIRATAWHPVSSPINCIFTKFGSATPSWSDTTRTSILLWAATRDRVSVRTRKT